MKPKRLHEHVSGLLRQRILREMAPGDRLESLPALAAEFAISVNTLRAALGLLSEEGIVESRHGSGVFVTSYRESLPVAVVCELDLSYPGLSSFWLCVTQSIRRHLHAYSIRERPYLGHTAPAAALSHPTCQEFLDDLCADRIRGVISVVKLLHPEYRKSFDEHPVPAVNTGWPDAPAPETNEGQVVAAAIRRLVANGRRHIAILGCAYRDHLSTSFTSVSATLKELELEIPEKWIRDDLAPNLTGAGWEQFRELWGASKEKPDALIVLDDMLIKDAALAITELGIDVPGQLHVTVHVNRGSEPYTPFPVDRIVMNPDNYAARLVEDMVSLLSGGSRNPEPVECVFAEYQTPAIIESTVKMKVEEK